MLEVVLVANAREGSTQEHDWARDGIDTGNSQYLK